MGKFTVFLTHKAIVKSSIQVEADSEEAARQKAQEFITGNSSETGPDGMVAESIYDIEWSYDQLDENDTTQISYIRKKS